MASALKSDGTLAITDVRRCSAHIGAAPIEQLLGPKCFARRLTE